MYSLAVCQEYSLKFSLYAFFPSPPSPSLILSQSVFKVARRNLESSNVLVIYWNFWTQHLSHTIYDPKILKLDWELIQYSHGRPLRNL